MIKKVIKYITDDIWEISTKEISTKQAQFVKKLRVIILSFRGFHEDKCFLRASALGFYSLLSIVPMLALIFGVADGFGLARHLTSLLLEKFHGQEAVVLNIIKSSHILLENTKEELIAGIGIIILFWVVIRVLGNIERSFNDIWGTKASRKLGRKLIDYFFIVIVFPILFIMSSSLTVIVSGRIEYIINQLTFLKILSPFLLILLRLLPYGVIWLLFSVLYIYMPNNHVKLKSGIIAGIIAGTIFQIVQWVYIIMQINIAKYNAIYGSFAALPFLLIWLQLSWSIVLFGAEISYAHQNADEFENSLGCLHINAQVRKRLYLHIMTMLINRFQDGAQPLSAAGISEQIQIPMRLIQQLLLKLHDAKLIVEVKQKNSDDIFYQPAKDPELYTIHFVLDAIDKIGNNQFQISDSIDLEKINKSLDKIDETIRKSRANIQLKDL